jgi:cobalt-zinc-cadmium efflux system protein
MAAAPRGTDLAAIRMFLLERPGVSAIHDLHVWPISTTETALTCHLCMPNGAGDAFLMETAQQLKASFRIGHTTLQVETHPDNGCALAPDDVV